MRAEPPEPPYRSGAFETKNRHNFLNDAQRRRSGRQRTSWRWATSRIPQLPMAFREQSASSLCSTMPRSDQRKAETAHHPRPNRDQRAARRQGAFLKKVTGEISFSETPFVRRMQDSFFRNDICQVGAGVFFQKRPLPGGHGIPFQKRLLWGFRRQMVAAGGQKWAAWAMVPASQRHRKGTDSRMAVGPSLKSFLLA